MNIISQGKLSTVEASMPQTAYALIWRPCITQTGTEIVYKLHGSCSTDLVLSNSEKISSESLEQHNQSI